MAKPTDDNLERLLLADDATLRAVSAWTSLPKHAAEQAWLELWGPGVWYDPEQWRAAAGLTSVEFEGVRTRLAAMAMIDPAGQVWPPVLQLARTTAARMLGQKLGGKHG